MNLPGWESSPADSSLNPLTEDSKLDVRIYAVDTCNRWMGAACLSVQDFEKTRHQALLLEPYEQLDSHAGRCVQRESAVQSRAGQSSLLECLKLVSLALSISECFSGVPALDVAGHWFYLVYQMFDASVLCRSAFWAEQTPGLLASDLAHEVVAQLIAHDLSRQNGSPLAVELKKRGGACVDARYQQHTALRRS